jgi:hypothetical protein
LGKVCARFARLPYGSVNVLLLPSLRFIQIAFGDFGNPANDKRSLLR